MNTIRIRKHLDSDMLHLPELRGMIGHDVEIVVRDDFSSPSPEVYGGDFWNPPSLEELALRQGFRGPLEAGDAFGSLADADWEGFDEWLEEQRRPRRSQGLSNGFHRRDGQDSGYRAAAPFLLWRKVLNLELA